MERKDLKKQQVRGENVNAITQREREANSRAMGHSFTGKAVFYNAQLVSSLSLSARFLHTM